MCALNAVCPISWTPLPDDTQTNTTWYFYDKDGRVRFEVNALGERKEYRYNNFGQLEQELSYYDRLTDYPDFSAADLQELDGGVLSDDMTALLSRGSDTGR